MKNRKLIGIIIAAIAVILVCFGGIYLHQQKQIPSTGKSKSDETGLRITKNNKTNSNSDSRKSDSYSNDEWMLMGYMAYAHDNYVQSRHIQNNADLVKDVGEDLADGSLKAVKNSPNTYTLTNKFGSVDVTVESEDVKVGNDGTTITAKSELKSIFSKFDNQIKKMTDHISEDSSSNTEDSNNSDDDDADGKGSVNQALTGKNLVVAAYLNGFAASTPAAKIRLAKDILKKDETTNAKEVPADDFINGFYNDSGYVNIASNLSTSHYAGFKVSNNSDDIVERYGGGGVINHRHLSKKKIIKTWAPYKDDIEQIVAAIEYNGKRAPALNKARTQQ